MNAGILANIMSAVIALGSLVVAIIVLSKNTSKDVKQDTKEDLESRAILTAEIKVLQTKLEAIDDGIRDIKAENRSFRSELAKIRDDLRKEIRSTDSIANHALELAEAAHRRLDRIGADRDPIQDK